MVILKIRNHQGDWKNPLENKNKHIRTKGPTPKTNKTIFAFLGFVLVSLFLSIILGVNFFFGILTNKLSSP